MGCSGVVWCEVCFVMWCGVGLCGVVWGDVVWACVVWSGIGLCGVELCGMGCCGVGRVVTCSVGFVLFAVRCSVVVGCEVLCCSMVW